MKRAENAFFLAVAVALLVRVMCSPRDASAWAPILGLVLIASLYYVRAFIPGTPEKKELEALKKELLEVKGNVQTLSVKVGLSR